MMAARKRKEPSSDLVTVKVLVPFNGMYAGDTAAVTVDETVQGWINAGLVRVVYDGGESAAGSGAAEPADQGSVAVRTGHGSETSGEPSQGFGAGGYGAFES
jgi:hypothetical protein